MDYRLIACIALFAAFTLLGMFLVCILERKHTGIMRAGSTDEEGRIMNYSFTAELRERICDAGIAGTAAGVAVFVAAAWLTVTVLQNVAR